MICLHCKKLVSFDDVKMIIGKETICQITTDYTFICPVCGKDMFRV